MNHLALIGLALPDPVILFEWAGLLYFVAGSSLLLWRFHPW